MKITHNKVGQNLNLTDAGKTEKAGDKAKASEVKNQSTIGIRPDSGESSKVELSSRAKDIQTIKNIATNAPDIDQAKVDRFQKLIDAGKYKVDARAVASKMVDELTAEQTSNE